MAVADIAQECQKRFGFGIADGIIDVYDTIREKFTHRIDQNNPIAKGLTGSGVVTVYIDKRENIWVGTWNSGLFLLEKGKSVFKNIKVDNSNGVFKSNRIMSFAEDSMGTIWIGSFLSGLYSYNPKSKTFTHHKEPALTEKYIDTKKISEKF